MSSNFATARNNLLLDPIISVRFGLGRNQISLSELLGRLLCGDDVSQISGLTAEQRGPVWRFLVRCAAEFCRIRSLIPEQALPDADTTVLGIQDVLADRASGLDSWLLHNPDLLRPAFLQCPMPSSSLSGAKYTPQSPSVLSLTLGGKAHERKPDFLRRLSAEQVAFALITHQTGVIYTKGNRASQLAGSASGKGSGTPYVGVVLGEGLGTTFRHDVCALLSQWELARSTFLLRGNIWALWTEAWTGDASIGSEKLSPAFIPLARLVRVGTPDSTGGYTTVWTKPTTKARVVDHTGGSGLGDPFLPRVANPNSPGTLKARGTMGSGYRYDEVVRLTFDNEGGAPAPSVQYLTTRRATAGDVLLRFEGVAFDRGKTLGFHHRDVLLSQQNQADLEDPKELLVVNEAYMELVKVAQRALRGSASILMRGVPRSRRGDGARVDRGAIMLQRKVDAHYLEDLLETLNTMRQRGNPDGVIRWGKRVRDWAVEIFPLMAQELPIPVGRQRERLIYAEAHLKACLSHLNPSKA